MRSISLYFGAALAATLALPATAEPAATPPSPPPSAAPPAAPLTVTPPSPDMMARRMARRAARVDQDIQTLRAGLQLTPAQDALWPPVADAIRGVDAARGFRFRQTLAAAPSSIDGLKLQGDHMAAMGMAFSKLADATKPFVATLTADQKSRLPALLQGVRLPKAMSRALEIPQDTSGSSWGIGTGAGAAGPGPSGGQDAGGGSAPGQRMPSPRADEPTTPPGGPKQGQDDEE